MAGSRPISVFTPGSLACDLLEGPLPPGVSIRELAPPETRGSRWSLGPELSITIERQPFSLELRLRLHFPGFGQCTEILVDGRPVARASLDEGTPHADFRVEVPAGDGDARVLVRPDRWNEGASLVPGDLRPIALNVGELRLLHSALARGGLCPMPFTRKEVKGAGPFVPCCSPWLADEYLSLPPGEDPWNGEAASALRESVMDGSYRYCRRELCQTRYFLLDELERLREPGGEFVVTEANLRALKSGQLRMPDGPTAATVTADPRCNLTCGSCRSESMFRLDGAGEERVVRAAAELDAMAGSLRRLRVAGDGEPLFSPFLRELIRSLDREKFPALDIVELHTNGIFLEEKVFRELRPGSDRINRVHVSVDAGDKATYARVRGGDWNRLQKNLCWAAAERSRGRFEALVLLFVYRAENFRSMPELARRCAELGADAVHFSPVQEWERAKLAYEATAVHLPTHPLHAEFLAVRSEVLSFREVTLN